MCLKLWQLQWRWRSECAVFVKSVRCVSALARLSHSLPVLSYRSVVVKGRVPVDPNFSQASKVCRASFSIACWRERFPSHVFASVLFIRFLILSLLIPVSLSSSAPLFPNASPLF